MNKHLTDNVVVICGILGIIFGIILLACFVFHWNPGSNADINPLPDATIVCINHFLNETATYQYSYLNELNSKDAYDFAVANNCSFEHSRFKLNVTGGNK